KDIKETEELLPRYTIDNIFDSSKFKNRFPDFKVTSYQQGIRNIIDDYALK
ncbi:MAG: NAD-dependent dehydratase, partial [Polaribacter sp.]|nr:NAD-dependent dehydratase [Polaribacter sp.]